jgi:hypothetical protein
MVRFLLQSVLCVTLCPLLVAQQATTGSQQQPVPQPHHPAAATTPAQPQTIRIPKDTEIELVALEPVSSATATKGQLVRLAVAKDLMVNGLAVIPRGALATGSVTGLHKAAPGKKDGSIRVSRITLTLGDGRRVKLKDCPSAGEDCGDIAPRWELWTIFLPFTVLARSQDATENRHETTRKPQGKGETIDACYPLYGFVRSLIVLRAIDLQIAAPPPNNTAPCKLAAPIKAAAVGP